MGTVLVNGTPVEIGASERLNVIQAADRVGVEVPRYCWHPALTVVASCRMCLVETGEKKPDGTVAMGPKLVPGCQTPVKDGMVIVTNSDKVKAAQAQTLEYLLLNHPLDCPVCDQAGECWLQDYSYRYGHAHSRLHEPKIRRPDKDYIGNEITLFTDRCVMCSRCVRFTREVAGTAELQIINRGSHAEIDIFPGNPCNNKLAGNVVDICPVGRPVQQGLPLQAAGLVAADEGERLPQLQHGLQHHCRSKQRACLPAAAARQSTGPRPLHVRRGSLRLQVRASSGSARRTAGPTEGRAAVERLAHRARGRPLGARRGGPNERRRRRRPVVALDDLRRGVFAREVPEVAVAPSPLGAGPRADRGGGRPLSEGRRRTSAGKNGVYDPRRKVSQPRGRVGRAAALRGKSCHVRRDQVGAVGRPRRRRSTRSADIGCRG